MRLIKSNILILLASLAFSSLIPGGANLLHALNTPVPKGRINDTAGMLAPHTRDYLNKVLAELERTDSSQVMVLTIASLEGESLEDFSLRVAEKWGVGQKGKDNGVLLLIAQKERKIRIEVGYGLESVLTDLRAGRIIDNVMVPQFKKGRFDRGVTDGVMALVDTIQGEYSAQETPHGPPKEPYLIPKVVVGFLTFIVLLVVMLKDNFFSPAAACGIIAPGAGAVLYDLSMVYILSLVPVGFTAGLVFAWIRRLINSRKSRYGEYRIEWHDNDGPGGSSGGGSGISFGGSSGSGSSGGSSSGGGGSFGGGGASGGW